MEARTPDWIVEKLALGELPPEQATEARKRLEAEPGGLERLEELARSDREVLAAHPASRMAATIRRRAASHPREAAIDGRLEAWKKKLAWSLAVASPAAVAIALLLVVLPRASVVAPPEALEVNRSKGLSPRLMIHRQHGDAPELVADGSTARAHDLLQLSYVAAGRAFGVIVSLDGGGTVTLHLPERGATAATLEPQKAIPLPHSYELDEAPRFERFVLVTSSKPFPVETALRAARALVSEPLAETQPLYLPEGIEQASILVKKTR